jgi:hypothetical protein
MVTGTRAVLRLGRIGHLDELRLSRDKASSPARRLRALRKQTHPLVPPLNGEALRRPDADHAERLYVGHVVAPNACASPGQVSVGLARIAWRFLAPTGGLGSHSAPARPRISSPLLAPPASPRPPRLASPRQLTVVEKEHFGVRDARLGREDGKVRPLVGREPPGAAHGRVVEHRARRVIRQQRAPRQHLGKVVVAGVGVARGEPCVSWRGETWRGVAWSGRVHTQC